MSDSPYDPVEVDVRERRYERQIAGLKGQITRLRKAMKEAEQDFEHWECPACYFWFKVEDGDLDRSFFCPLCKGTVRPVLQYVKERRLITQKDWDAAQEQIRHLKKLMKDNLNGNP